LNRPIRYLAIAVSIAALLAVSVFALAAMARAAVDAWGAYVVYDRARLPRIDTALVLGTAPYGVGGQDQRTLSWRLDAAAGLWHGAIVEHFIVSGIRIGEHYDEALVMRQELVARGVPASAIELDQHGNRTWDSIARARYTFGKRRLLIVSQPDHLARALFLARHIGIEAWGVPARGDNYGGLYGTMVGNAVSLIAYIDLLKGSSPRVIAAGLPR
jgi:SanA protein